MTRRPPSATRLPPGAWPWLHEAGRVVARYLHRPAYRLRVEGAHRVPESGPVVLVANHSSLVEPQLIFGMLPRRSVFLVKEELFTGPIGWCLRRIGQVPVRRNAPDRTSLHALVTVLADGGLVAVFPEGTRGDGDVALAQRGAAWLVRSAGAVVLPVAVRGTRRPPGTRFRWRPRVTVRVGEPFTPDVGPGRAGLAEATEHIRTALATLVAELDEDRERGHP